MQFSFLQPIYRLKPLPSTHLTLSTMRLTHQPAPLGHIQISRIISASSSQTAKHYQAFEKNICHEGHSTNKQVKRNRAVRNQNNASNFNNMCRERGENVIHKEKKRMLKKKEQERALRSSGKLTFFFFFSKITCKLSNLEGKFEKNLSNYVAK